MLHDNYTVGRMAWRKHILRLVVRLRLALALQENRVLAKQFSKGEGANRSTAAEAVAGLSSPEQSPQQDHRTGISRFMPTSRRIVQVCGFRSALHPP